MALKIKNSEQGVDLSNKIVYQYTSVEYPIPHLPHGEYQKTIPKIFYVVAYPIKVPSLPPVEMQEVSLPRALNYYADYGGCGFWRMIWPEVNLNAYQKACISVLTSMV